MPGGGADIQDWFRSLPLFTRSWFGGTILFTLLGRFSLLSPNWLVLTWETFITKFVILPSSDYLLQNNSRFHIWRPVTALFYYPLSPQTGFHFLINLYFLYNYRWALNPISHRNIYKNVFFSLRLETGIFDGRPADYFFMLIFNWILSVIIALFMRIPFLMDPMVMSILYVWCQLNKDTIVNFWFGTQFKAMYLPWVLFGFNLIISGKIDWHIFYFLFWWY